MQGIYVVLALPSGKGKKPVAHQEYVVRYSEDGTLVLISKINVRFASGERDPFYKTVKWESLAPNGR